MPKFTYIVEPEFKLNNSILEVGVIYSVERGRPVLDELRFNPLQYPFIKSGHNLIGRIRLAATNNLESLTGKIAAISQPSIPSNTEAVSKP